LIRSLLLAVLIVGCAHAPGPAPAPIDALRAKDLYPLRVGNKWTYEIRSAGQKAVRTVELVGEKDGFFLSNPPGKLRHDSTGLRDDDRYLIQNPVEAGRTWMSVVSVQSTEQFQTTEAGHPCTVQAGTFGRCATVRATNAIDSARSIVIESTYAEGVGLVALHIEQVTKGHPPVTQQEMELLSYHLAP
jgi:hypothetical protein